MKPTIKIGYGYDVHQLTPQVDLWLGGIKIPHTHDDRPLRRGCFDTCDL